MSEGSYSFLFTIAISNYDLMIDEMTANLESADLIRANPYSLYEKL